MAGRVSIKHKRREAPEWVFPWKQPGRPMASKWIPFLLVTLVFIYILTSVRIHVTPPKPWSALNASLIQVLDNEQGMALTLRAREGGPFPSRFEPRDWAAAPRLEQALADAGHWSPRPYSPTLRDLPHSPMSTAVRLAEEGKPVLPKRVDQPPANPVSAPLKPGPVLRPLSRISAAEVAGALPAFDAAVDAAMIAEDWRFLIQLDATGNVSECISLAGGDEAGQTSLIDWLRRVTFKPDLGKASRWIALGVEFTNQSADESIHR